MPEQTLYSEFQSTVEKYGENEAVASIEQGVYVPITYRELDRRVQLVVDELRASFSKGARVAILLDNGPDWPVIDLAAAATGLIVVPIHATYNTAYIQKILEHSEASGLFVSGALFEKHVNIEMPVTVKVVYLAGSTGDAATPHAQNKHGFQVKRIENIYKISTQKAPSRSLSPASSHDIHTLVYTSGTSGFPKAVMLSHANIISNVSAALKKIPVGPSDRFFSFLPLSHILERTAGQFAPLITGAAIYYSRSTATLADDLKLAKPTILIGVPRIFERVHEKIIAKFQKSKFLATLFRSAMHLAHKKHHGALSTPEKIQFIIFNKIIFKKIRAAFGGRLSFAISGGASLSKHIAEFFESVGILILEGYGLTESSPILAANGINEYRFGSVGKPLDGVEITLSSTGEILARGPNIMKGYYKAPALTQEIVDSEGWLHTGDLGTFDAEGFLTILGRIKEMIVLSTGRNVFPVPIEQALEESKYIAQAMVYGDNQKTLSAHIVIDLENIKKMNVEGEEGSLLINDRVINLIRSELDQQLLHFPSHEQIKDFVLRKDPFTIENGMLTPTLKLKRHAIRSFEN